MTSARPLLNRSLLIIATLILSSAVLQNTASGEVAPIFSYSESAGDWLGENIANAGDVNGDGVDDIIAGGRWHDGTRGLAVVISGIDGSVLYRFEGSAANSFLGQSVAGLGDLNSDGFADFAITNQTLPLGEVRVHSGIDGSTLFTTHHGVVSGIGDVNADGTADIAIGYGGLAEVRSGVDGALLFPLYADITGFTGFAQDSYKLSSGGDVNADGFDDIIIGAMYQSESVECYASGKAYVYSGADGSLLYSYTGDDCKEYVGVAVAGLGDLNSDGYDDFAVASLRELIVYSGSDGSEMYNLLTGSSYWMTVSSIEDIDSDGTADIVVGTNTGGLFVYSGATGLRAAWRGWVNPTLTGVLGGRFVGSGDFNGDGTPDVAFSDYWNASNGEKTGVVRGLQITPGGTNCCYSRGDARADGRINISDVTFAVARIFSGGVATACLDDADANADGAFNIADVTFLVNHIFGSQTINPCVEGQ